MLAEQRTAADPGVRELVEIGSHTVTSVHRPTLDLMLNGTRLGRVAIDLTIEFAVAPLIAAVQGGRLVSVHPSRVKVDAQLACAGQQVAHKQAELQLPGTLPVGPSHPGANRAVA